MSSFSNIYADECMNYTYRAHYNVSGIYKVIYQIIYTQISLRAKRFITLILCSVVFLLNIRYSSNKALFLET